jgi:SNF2 family DNA or RNA helicase
MLDVDLVPKQPQKLLVRVPPDEPPAAKAALDSLLSAAYSEHFSGYTMAAWEFPWFEQILDDLQAPSEGEMTLEAADAIKTFCAWRAAAESLKTSPPDQSMLERIHGWKTKPYDDQLQCIRFHTHCGRSIEAGETGIGKSLNILYTYLYWRTEVPGLKGLIICANSGKLDWASQVEMHTDAKAIVCGNGTAQVLADIARFKGGADLLVVHYDALLQKKVYDTIYDLEFGYIAIDEAHYIKSPQAKRHKNVMALLARNRKAKMTCATGTAIDGSPKSAWALLRIVLPGYLPGYHVFHDYYTIRKPKFMHGHRIMVDVGVRNLRHLKDLLAPVAIRFLKADVVGRPSKIFQTRIVELTGEQKFCYEQIKNAVRVEVERGSDAAMSLMDVANRVLRLRQILNHPALAHFDNFKGDSAKYQELDNILEEILSNPDAQVLVWTQWRESVERLVKRYREYGAIALYGGSKDVEVRDKVMKKEARVVVAIPEKAGTSIDWLRVCRTAVYLEKPWSLTLYRQSLDRIDRRSNTDSALIITVECPGTVDQMVNAVLTSRQNMFDAISLADEKLVSMGKEDLLRFLK